MMTKEEAIQRFKMQLATAQAILNVGYGVSPGENNHTYEVRRDMAAIALDALLQQAGASNLKPTNGNRIRAMTDEELAAFLCEIAYTGREPWSEPFARAFCDKCQTYKCTMQDTGQVLEMRECDFVDGKCPHGSDSVWWLQQDAVE